MATQKAVVIQGPGEAKVVADAPIPKPEKDFIKVKTVSVALNPSDWKHIDWRADKNAVVGFDYAGYVEEVGPDVKKQFQKGDRVLGFTHGSNTLNHATGAFAEHVIGKGHVAMIIPPSVNFDDASTLGTGLTTIGLSLYKSLQLPLPSQPSKEPFPVFVYGGSTATGILAIQFLKLSGLTVITACGVHNFDLVKSYGADACFDYRDVDCGKKVREYTGDKIEYVFDTISTQPSAAVCAEAMSSTGGRYTCILAVDFPRRDCKTDFVMGYTINGEAYKMGPNAPLLPAKPDDCKFGEMFFRLAEELLAAGRFRAHRATVGKGGLYGVLEGLQLMREGKVSGTKLVYRVEYTS